MSQPQPPTPQLQVGPQLPQQQTSQLQQVPQQLQHLVQQFSSSQNGVQAISLPSHNVTTMSNPSGVGTPRSSQNLFGTPQPHSTLGSSPTSADISTPTEPSATDQDPDSTSEETSYVLQLIPKDFYSPTIQNYLCQQGVSLSLSPSQSTGSRSVESPVTDFDAADQITVHDNVADLCLPCCLPAVQLISRPIAGVLIHLLSALYVITDSNLKAV